MAIRDIVTRGWGNGTYDPGVNKIPTYGYSISADVNLYPGELTVSRAGPGELTVSRAGPGELTVSRAGPGELTISRKQIADE